MVTKSQSEIVSAWKGEKKALVSIVCTTFNHEQYIQDALDSFLAQETHFPFEIIVHDDASSDKTADIIRSYAVKYPDIVKPVLQQENQFAKGGFKPSIYAAGFSSAKFIALCEGDDFWICNDKLQVQVEAMERHTEIDFSFHSALVLREGVSEKTVSWSYESDRVIRLDELMTRYTSSFAPTASYMIRRTLIARLPDWFYSLAPVGDFFIERYGALRGGALYIDRPMAVYREMVPGSWNARIAVNNQAYRKHVKVMHQCLELMAPEFSEYRPLLLRHAANLSLYCALRELSVGNDDSFSQQVKASVAQYKYTSNKQRLAYFLRFCPSLLRWILHRRQST